MSGGGLLQLVAFGAQDIYLTGNPEITFWNVAYRRHTNFAMDSMEQTFQGSVDFGRKVTCVVARNGDLVHKGYLQVTLPQLTANAGEEVAWTRNIGHVLINEISVEIGGSVIDKVTGQYLTIRNELTQSAEKEDGYNVMIGNTVKLTTLASSIDSTTLYVPLPFWFNRVPGLALPLIALMYHEVKINVTFRPLRDLYVTSDNTPLTSEPSLPSAALFLDYIFLKQDERRSFSQSQHEYLIEQLQFQGAESFTNSAVRSRLNLSHPVKELIWVLQLDSNVTNGANRWTDFTDNGTGPNPYAGSDPLSDAKITLNTHDRITTRKASYFNIVQPYFHHTRVPVEQRRVELQAVHCLFYEGEKRIQRNFDIVPRRGSGIWPGVWIWVGTETGRAQGQGGQGQGGQRQGQVQSGIRLRDLFPSFGCLSLGWL